ncbi:uncharacterized protein LOC134259614 [Saccostrea cucullata]|uniref:uncharacterized protein LOC134259614 n=1 Tax=Saccostrea cuccullata TaxID=36930 RepID=UPI002ED525C3
MSGKLRPYSCVTCHKRIKKSERRPVTGSQNKALRQFLSKTFVTDLCDADVVCNKCRQLYYSSKQSEAIVSNEIGKENANPKGPQESSESCISLPIPSTGYRHDACAICSKKPRKLVVVSEQSRHELFMHTGVLLTEGSRCCSRHVSDRHLTAETVNSGVSSKTRNHTTFNNEEVCHLLESVRQLAKRKDSTRIDFDNDSSLTDEDYRNLTGLTRSEFDDLMSNIKEIRQSKSRSTRTCVAILLVKLKCALDNKMLATMFNMKKWQVRRAVSSARKALMSDFVPHNLGFGHISREEVIGQHTRPLAQELFSNGLTETPQALLVLDGTYIYIQKSNNFSFSRRSYSLHKHRPLIKPMMIVTTSGYIVSVLGPYLADTKNNDAGILNNMIQRNVEEMTDWVKEGDTFIVDRGFRDSSSVLADLGIRMEMPCFLAKGSKQHSTEESNCSRLITKVRWVVESANGRLKRWRYLDRTVPNTQIPYVGDYVRIISAICNKYKPPLSSGEADEDLATAYKMLHLSRQPNALRLLVESEGMDQRSYPWTKIDATDVAPDFPRLSEEEIRELTLGTYQVKLARSYANEHLNEDGSYEIHINEDIENIVSAKIQSRHVSAKRYLCWIQHSNGVIQTWYCKCKAGSRVVGCCAHITSVVWYLSYARYQEKPVMGVRDWAEYLEDAARVIDATDSEDSETEE